MCKQKDYWTKAKHLSICILKLEHFFFPYPPSTHQQITIFHTKQIHSRSKLPFFLGKNISYFWINIQLNCWIWSFCSKFFEVLLSASNHSCGCWSFCEPGDLSPHGPYSMHPTSWHPEKTYFLSFFSPFGFLGTCASKYLLYMLLWFLVVAALGLSQCLLARQERDIQRDYKRDNISSWKVTNAPLQVFESCLQTQEAAYIPAYVCLQVCLHKLDHKKRIHFVFCLISNICFLPQN